MDGVAADHAAERDRSVIRLLALLRRLHGNGNSRGNFQRGVLQRAGRSGQERIGDILVEARLDDEDAHIRKVVGVIARASPRLGHGLDVPLSARQ